MSGRKLFKYFLEQRAVVDSTEVLFKRCNRWRNDPLMYPNIMSKYALFSGYLKYGILTSLGMHFLLKLYGRIKDSIHNEH